MTKKLKWLREFKINMKLNCKNNLISKIQCIKYKRIKHRKIKSRNQWNIECKYITEKSTKLRFGSLKMWIHIISPLRTDKER